MERECCRPALERELSRVSLAGTPRVFLKDLNKFDWRIVVISSLIPFGIHYAQGLGSLREFFLDDPDYDPRINGERWGMFQTVMYMPNLFLPIIGGLVMDAMNKMRIGIVFFLVITCLGQLLFTFGTYTHSFPLACAGRLVFGTGSGCVSLASGAVASKSFRKRKRIYTVPIAIGIGQSVHALSTMLSAYIPILIAQHFGNYWSPLLVGFFVCVMSTMCGILLWNDEDIDRVTAADQQKSILLRFRDSILYQPLHLYLLLLVHFCTSGSHRLFSHVDVAFFYDEYSDVDLRKAGLMSGSESFLGLFIPPLLGAIFIQKEKTALRPTLWMMCACIIGSIAYFLLSHLANPVLPLTMLSLVNATTPTLLKVLVAVAVPFQGYATAFGLLEASESLVKTIGGVAVGAEYDRSGSYITVVQGFGFLLLLGFLSLCIFLYLARPEGIPPCPVESTESEYSFGLNESLLRYSDRTGVRAVEGDPGCGTVSSAHWKPNGLL